MVSVYTVLWISHISFLGFISKLYSQKLGLERGQSSEKYFWVLFIYLFIYFAVVVYFLP